MSIKIKKASGLIEDFNASKLRASLMNSGADEDTAREIIARVMPDIAPLTSTKKIYRLAHKYLRRYNRSSVLRYSLKNAMMRLGPTGYPFEKYIGKLLAAYGYSVQVGVRLDGACVSHEVDVLAERGEEVIFVECKFRNSADSAPDVKIAMYVHSRFRDLFASYEKQFPEKTLDGWLVTNTKFTSDAVTYADCSGVTLKSWRCPKKESLEKMIEEKKLYPVTVLSGLTTVQLKKLFARDVILMKDLARLQVHEVKQLLSVTERRAAGLRDEADKLCFC